MVEIGTPLALPNGQILPNRLAKAAMTEGLADCSGQPTEALCSLYRRWGAGGAGLLVTGNTAVDAEHLERAGNVVIAGVPNAQGMARLRYFATAAKVGGSQVWVQISHAGRQTPLALNPAPRAPSAVPMSRMPLVQFGRPVQMTSAEIEAVVSRFALASRVVEDAGFDGVQIHAAHGYLLSSFLSPLANRRTDRWGGSVENRARILLKIVEEVRASAGSGFAVSVKLNSADFQRGGFDLDDSATIAGWLDEAGVDLLEVSGGTYEAPRMMGSVDEPTQMQASTAACEAYFVEFAPRIRASLRRAALMMTGGFRSVAAMNDALSANDVDVIGLARPLLFEPGAAAELLKGRPRLRAIERELRVGPGILSENSRVPLIRALNRSSVQAWYYEQMDRLGAGLETAAPRRLVQAAGAYLKRDAAKRKRWLAHRDA
jgi:2,4-dienoyl-CoA reductase-like NADH-dependent reductase (Old Yellow Enzyme family)